MTVHNRHTASWRYVSGGSRDLRLDLLRGFAVFAMAVDHIGGDSPFHLLSGGNRFFVSAAEAFVFISGVTVGLVYGRPSETARSIGGGTGSPHGASRAIIRRRHKSAAKRIIVAHVRQE